MVTARRLSSIVVAAAILAACVIGWQEVSFIDQVAWSEDDASIALVVLHYEEKDSANPLNGTTDKRNWRHQVFVESPDGGARTAITTELAGQNGAELYYMRGAGYLVLSVQDEAARWFERIDLDGTVREIARFASADCQARFFDVVPSPDGSLIASLHGAPGCVGSAFDGPPSPTGSGIQAIQRLEVTFLDAATLEPVASHTLELSALNLEWTWTPAQDFVVTDNHDAWSLAPGRAPQATAVPGCAWPKTTSSAWSSEGEFISGQGDSVVHTAGTHPDEAFGCQ